MKKLYVILTLLVLISLIFLILKKKVNRFDYIQIKKGDVTESIYGLGKVKTNQKFEVKIGVIANVKELYVSEGSVVTKGDKLISFEGTNVFVAPFDGTITYIASQKGEIVMPQVPVLRLENLKNKYVEVALEQDGALRVKPGQKAKIILANDRGDIFEGEITSLYPRNDEFIAHIAVKELSENILTGMTADVVIEVGHRSNVYLIPLQSIVNGTVVRKRNNNEEKIKITIGHVDEQWAELIKGDIIESDEVQVKRKK